LEGKPTAANGAATASQSARGRDTESDAGKRAKGPIRTQRSGGITGSRGPEAGDCAVSVGCEQGQLKAMNHQPWEVAQIVI